MAPSALWKVGGGGGTWILWKDLGDALTGCRVLPCGNGRCRGAGGVGRPRVISSARRAASQDRLGS